MELFHPLWGPPPSHLELHSQDVHVWLASLDRLGACFGEMSRLLSQDESTRAARFFFERDRTRFILCRGMLRTLLALYLSADPHELRFSLGAYGKPGLSEKFADSGIQFNLSRSDRFSLFGITRSRRIGVDIEKIRPMPNAEQEAALIFSKQENLVWSNLPDHLKERAFFRGFVCKEACIKAMGMGFFQPPEKVELLLEPEKPARIVRINGNEDEGSRWSILEMNPAGDYGAALVTENGPCWISYYTW